MRARPRLATRTVPWRMRSLPTLETLAGMNPPTGHKRLREQRIGRPVSWPAPRVLRKRSLRLRSRVEFWRHGRREILVPGGRPARLPLLAYKRGDHDACNHRQRIRRGTRAHGDARSAAGTRPVADQDRGCGDEPHGPHHRQRRLEGSDAGELPAYPRRRPGGRHRGRRRGRGQVPARRRGAWPAADRPARHGRHVRGIRRGHRGRAASAPPEGP